MAVERRPRQVILMEAIEKNTASFRKRKQQLKSRRSAFPEWEVYDPLCNLSLLRRIDFVNLLCPLSDIAHFIQSF